MSKEDLIDLLLPVGCVGIICIIVFSVLYSVNNKINNYNLCKSYESITGEKVWLNDKAPFQVFGEDLQLLVLKDRVSFLREDGTSMGRPSFASSYFCKGFLPKQIIIRDLTNAIGEK